MTQPCFFPRLAGLAAALSLLWTVPAAAQDDLGTIVDRSILAMKAEDWPKALALNTQAIETFGKNSQVYGARFGTIHYRKGLCELKLGKWKEAAQSFETCYRDFPNKDAGRGNQFHKMALLKWAEAMMGLKQWQQAIDLFEKFLKERDKALDKYPQGTFHIAMAVCHYELGRIPQGNEHLETAIKNKRMFPTTDAAIMAGFQSLATSAIRDNKEQALLDFIGKNRGDLVIEPFAMHGFTRVFMKLGADALNADMARAAMAIYQFVPSLDVMIDDIQVRLASMGPLNRIDDGSIRLLKKKLEKDLAQLEEERKGKVSPEITRLAAMAFIHEKNGNIRAAHSTYLRLVTQFPNAEKHEEHLYNLVRTSSQVLSALETQKWADLFLKSYKDSMRAPAVRRLSLSALFYEGEYEECIELAEALIGKLKPDTPEHDICLHVLGGSYFYTGRAEKAQPLLDEHVKRYPESLVKVPAAYFQASNLIRLQKWDDAAQYLDAFLKKYPKPSENIFLPFALYDRATCHYAQDEPQAALEKLEMLSKGFRDSNVTEQAYTLRGNLEQSLGNDGKAEEAYLKALEIAETRKNDVVAGEALFSLVALLADDKSGKENPRSADALKYAERFWKDYAQGSPYRTRMAVAQVPAFFAAGREDEALQTLQQVIADLAGNPEARGLEELINSHTEAYLEKYPPEKLKELYYNFPGIRFGDKAARALLRVAVIGVFEQELRKAEGDVDRLRKANAMIEVLFRELKSDFELKELAGTILIKVGDYLRTTTKTPREALPYYEEALKRDDRAIRLAALLGRADVYGRSADAGELEQGIQDFIKFSEETDNDRQRDFALYRIVELQMAKKDYAKVEAAARAYLDSKRPAQVRAFSAPVGLLLAQSFELRNDMESAIAMYLHVWSSYTGKISASAPAMAAWMKLLWERNRPAADARTPSDRQGAYEGGARYIVITSRLKDKMTDEDLARWKEVEQLVSTYEADAAVKSLQEIEEEKKAGR